MIGRRAAVATSRPTRRGGRGASSLPATGPKDGVLATYERLRRKYEAVLGDRLPLVLTARRLRPADLFIVRVSENSRAEADALCAKLRATGGACIVFRNPRG